MCVCVVDLAIHYTSRLTGIPICYHYDPLQLGLRTSATASKKLGSKDRTTWAVPNSGANMDVTVIFRL